MDYLPIFLNLKYKLCVVIGGGEVALRKTNVLLDAGATVRVVAPEILPELAAKVGVTAIISHFQPVHLDDAILVIAATNSRDVNQQISNLAQSKNLPVNVVDDPELCSFIMPAIVDRSPLMVAFSTGGTSPVLARMMRSKIESLIPYRYSRLAVFAERMRAKVKSFIQQPEQRRIFWESVLDSVIAEKILAGDEATAEALFEQQLLQQNQHHNGEVYLVGAGPGDSDLLTFRALRLMQKADVVVYDNLVAKAIVDMTRRDAQRIYVGKQRDNHTLPQEEINQLLVRLASDGHRVVRLKGGDPFIFGRGGEEIETLAAQGIPFQVVPGITAASGVAAYAGIPLTHRDHAQSCIFITGHLKDGTMNLDWETLAKPKQTVVIYMGLHGLSTLCAELIKHGMPADTPAALVQQGTTQNQRTFIGTLVTLPAIAESEKPQAPTLIIIGGVVTLREKLAWFNPNH